MTKKNKIRTLSMLSAFLVTGMASAQVTIGSNTEPNAGSLIDLKQEQKNDGTANSRRGLGLPRVKLTSLTIPDTQTLAQTIADTDATANWDKDAHIGLLVYNIQDKPSECVNQVYVPGFQKGVYVWDAIQWNRLPEVGDVRKITDNGTTNVNGNTVGTFTMQYAGDGVNPAENETYYYANFGDAGTWMTQNLRTQYTSSGLRIPANGNGSNTGLNTDKTRYYGLAYPSYGEGGPGAVGTGLDPTQVYDKHKEYGLFYNWHTVTDFMNCSTVDQTEIVGATPGPDEVETVEPNKHIKGICPTGWHIPSDREWTQLEEELTNHASLYSSSTNDGTWDAATWESKPGYRGTVAGTVMKSKTEAYDTPSTLLTEGDSKPASEGGFEVFLIAMQGSNQHRQRAYFWSASSGKPPKNKPSITVWTRQVQNGGGDNSLKVQRGPVPRLSLMSVRCKKD